jgi:3-hydroxyisobutyrate dehydrogenase-like beta-hydroxyacid dehydrogenase
MMIEQEYQPATMKMSVWEKDLDLIKELVDSHGTDAPLFNLTNELYKKARDLGLDDEDTASIYEILNANSSP